MKQGSTILVIDDNEAFRKLLAETLTLWGFNAAEAVDGQQAMTIIEQFSPDLITPRPWRTPASRRRP